MRKYKSPGKEKLDLLEYSSSLCEGPAKTQGDFFRQAGDGEIKTSIRVRDTMIELHDNFRFVIQA
jgi:hypothetical protein